jgi:hypothetical protein
MGTILLTVIAGIGYAIGYLSGKLVALALWFWVAFVNGYKAGL